jgi:hypothetical protein
MQHYIESVSGARVACSPKLCDQLIEAIVADLGWRTHGA